VLAIPSHKVQEDTSKNNLGLKNVFLQISALYSTFLFYFILFFLLITSNICRRFSQICPNDPTFYQTCGHDQTCLAEKGFYTTDNMFPSGACGMLICDWINKGISLQYINNISFRTNGYSSSFLRQRPWLNGRCNRRADCLNTLNGTSVDEVDCAEDNVKCFNDYLINRKQVRNAIINFDLL
jgi:hypothetical protein